MNIFFYATYSNQHEFLNTLRKKFKNDKIFTINDNIDLSKIDVAMVWNLPSNVFKKMVNLKAIFSIGAGVDHILYHDHYHSFYHTDQQELKLHGFCLIQLRDFL